MASKLTPYLTAPVVGVALLLLIVAMSACSPDDPDNPYTLSDGDGQATGDVGGDDNGSPIDNLEFDTGGCLTFAGAGDLCGSGSDGTVCQFAATCRTDSNTGQCSIDCEMSPTVGCIDKPSAQCVWDAKLAQDCTALAACSGWALVY